MSLEGHSFGISKLKYGNYRYSHVTLHDKETEEKNTDI